VEQTLSPLDASLSASRLGLSAASWPAIFAGASVAASASLVLLALGSGLGFAAVSPWPGHGVSATTFKVTTAIWLIVMQWLSAALGGYIAGRLRTRWVGTHTHEVFFRDTAHGLVTWAVSTVVVAAVLAGSVSSLIGAGAHAVGGVAAAAAGGAQQGPSAAMTYDIDKLFRPGAAPAAGGSDAASDARVETAYIAYNAIVSGSIPDTDRSYLASLVSAQTGIPASEAQQRVNDFAAAVIGAETKAKETADSARKAAAEASIYTALSLLIGAFIASVAAAIGGRLRDEHP